MGQANSTGTAEPPPRRRARPSSWAPSLLNTLPGPSSPSSPSSPAAPRRNTLGRFSSLYGRHGAGSSGPMDTAPLRPRTRLSRARSSLSSMADLLHSRPSASSRRREPAHHAGLQAAGAGPHAALRHAASEHGAFLPRVQIPELDLHLDGLLGGAASTERLDAYRPRPAAPLSPLRRDSRALSVLPSQRRLRNMISPSRRRRSIWSDEDHMENMERLRRGEDQADILSRLLSLAAAATAATLVGENNPAATQDGTFDTFLQSLQNGSIASALRNNDGGDDSDSAGGNQQPLNFFRMFRFGSNADDRRNSRHGSRSTASGSSPHDGDEDGEGRLVPIIIVGIRSINPSASAGQDDSNIPPFIDALSSFPTPPASSGDNENMLRSPQNGTRFSHRRRASMGGFNFPANYDSQRHHRGQNSSDRQRPWSSFTESPPGPLPPPSTPATSFGLSAEPSGATTPATSTSPPSPTTQSAAPSRRESFVRRAATPALAPTAEEPQPQARSPRQRRMSESDFTRYGAGAPRRRGVVEPDNNPGEGSRSWIIYVLGGSYPENHPILTTPSLFTDSPTYEDMMLLSSILGPAKPPVASEDDVAAARGLFRIRNVAGMLVAEAVDGEESISLASDARCLVCLCDFEADEEARRLVKCEHVFHKICIDQWLTTGRNSCPLCRGQGVDEKDKDESGAAAGASVGQAAA
ncbi:hypothetical protein ACEQ8H_002951 [Pleosporales sp. CAS-2024a]